MMRNPVFVEVIRGNSVESRHSGRAAVVDADGATVLALGDIDALVFPRSSVKALQALPLVESGASDAFGFSEEMLALACASHGGEPGHTTTAAAALARIGLDARALECGAHRPTAQAAASALDERHEKPSALHNNCSGKHAGFLCVACHAGVPHAGYIGADHLVQREARAAMEDVTRTTLGESAMGIDGCGIPTYALPLRALAHGFARFGTGHGLGSERRRAAQRLRAAVAAHPWHVAGTKRFCTGVMEIFGARCFVKTGAEGVFTVALPEQGIGMAVKIDDGATRASEVATATLIARFLPMSAAERARFQPFLTPELKNWAGTPVGSLRPAEALAP